CRPRWRTDYDRCAAGASAGRRVGWRFLGVSARKVYAVLAWLREFCDCFFSVFRRTIRRLNTPEVAIPYVVDAVATGAEADQLRHPRDPEGHRAAGSHLVRRRVSVAGHFPGRAPARQGGRGADE